MSDVSAVALVTGAGSGIGEAAAIALADNFKIGVLGRTESEILETVDAIHSHGGEAIALVADVSRP